MMAKNTLATGHAAPSNRAYALDALRGLAILAMLLSGQEPFGQRALPAWMYHAQEPPPHHEWLGAVPGITWVDLVFPTFLFCMGAAFPLALARRLDQGASTARISLFILGRGFLLGFFALYVAAIRPYQLSDNPHWEVWLLALLGFFWLFPVLTRLPDAWSTATKGMVRAAGWTGAILFLALAHYPDPDHPRFWLGRSDIIILVLTNMAVFGSLVWVYTRHNLPLRLGVLGILFALRMSNFPVANDSWVTDIWNYSPASWLYECRFLQYLCIVIPGTIAGDLILQWTRAGQAAAADLAPPKMWSTGRYLAIAGLMTALVVVVLTGLETRVPTQLTTDRPGVFMLNEETYVRPWAFPATLLAFALGTVGGWLLREPGNETERLYQKIFRWGAYWLVLGLIFEPYEDGIKKDHPTMSYYFVTSGLASCLFIGFSVFIDRFKQRRWLQLLVDNGQNPMIAYAGINNFIIPVLFLTGGMAALAHLDGPPWRGFLRGLIIILLMAMVVSFLSRRKIFWRT
jgi:predicted acyltransferase